MKHQPLRGLRADAGELTKLLNGFGDLWREEGHGKTEYRKNDGENTYLDSLFFPLCVATF